MICIAPYLSKEWILPANMEPSSFLSVASIPDFLAQQFSGCQLLHTFSPEHLFLKTTVQQLLQCPISNWKFNRPPDILRCRDIAQTIYRQRAPIEAVFYLAYDSGPRRTFDVLDGIHRITALRHLLKKTQNPSTCLRTNLWVAREVQSNGCIL